MKILLLTQYYTPEVGAAQTRLASVVSALENAGDSVEVVTALPNYPYGKIADGYRRRFTMLERSGGVTVRRMWMYPAMGTGARRLASYVSFSIMCLYGLVRAERPDVVVVESPPLFVAVPALLYGRLRRRPVVVNVADLWPDAAVALGALSEGRVLRVMLRLERWVYRRAAIVSTVTEGVRARLEAKGVPAEKVVLLANGVDTTMFRPDKADPAVRSRLDLPDGDFVVYPGTMGLAHGLDPLIDAMRSVDGEAGLPFLLMIGGGSERERLERRVRDERISNVVFRDAIPVADLAGLLPAAMAGVVTSAEMAFNDASRPAKLFPLMAAGLPVLFAGGGEGAQIVERDDAGVVVANRPDAIAAALRMLSAQAAERHRLGQRGRDAVMRWSWDAQVQPWRAALASIVSR